MEYKTAKFDWAAIGNDYINGTASLRAIGRSFGVSTAAIAKHASAGGWKRLAIERPVPPIPATQWPVKSRASKKERDMPPRRLRMPDDAPEDGHFVYVIQESGGDLACKVGVSADPRSRLLQLQCATWRRLVLAAAFLAADSNEARYLERAVHQSFHGLHLSGEWFSVTADRAISEIRSCANAGGVVIKAARLIERS